MPRKPRLSVPGALHHVMSRGIEGRPVFAADEDRQYFLSLLSDGLTKIGYKCYAWVLMSNHYHLLLRANKNSLSLLMRPLNSKYARWFRKKDNSRGYLFQDRFKSLVTQDQGYIEELVRYIHLNPIRAGICRSIAELDLYPWSGHAVLVGRSNRPFQDTRTVLNLFSRDSKRAIREYRDYLGKGIGESKSAKQEIEEVLRKNNNGVVDRKDYRCWVIGDADFVKAVLEQDQAKRLQVARYCQSGLSLQKVVEEVCAQMAIDAGEIVKRGRDNNRSMLRKVVAAIAHRSCGIPIIEIARYYGLGSSSVSRMLDEGEDYVRENKIVIKH